MTVSRQSEASSREPDLEPPEVDAATDAAYNQGYQDGYGCGWQDAMAQQNPPMQPEIDEHPRW